MRVRSLALTLATLIVLGAIAAVPGTSGAAAAITQRCKGPVASEQSGRTTLVPGINGLAHFQTETSVIHLFQCTPTAATGGTGSMKIVFKPPTAVTCTSLTTARVYDSYATITWQNAKTSTLKLKLAFNATNRLVLAGGKIGFGVLAGHLLIGQFRYKPTVSPNGHSVPEACANKVAPGHVGTGTRISIVGFTLWTTQPFTIY